MVGMGMGLEDPLHAQVMLADMGDDAVGEIRLGAAGGLIVVERRVDDRAAPVARRMHEVADGVGIRMEERGDLRLDHAASPLLCRPCSMGARYGIR